jgi:hypothetical protein
VSASNHSQLVMGTVQGSVYFVIAIEQYTIPMNKIRQGQQTTKYEKHNVYCSSNDA